MPIRKSRTRKTRRPAYRRLLIAGGVLGVVLVLLALRPMYRQWRVSSNLERAREALAGQQWQQALGCVAAAQRAQPGCPEAYLIIADILIAAEGSPDDILQALDLAKRAGVRSPDLLLKMAQASLRQGDLRGAQSALYDVPAEERTRWLAIDVEASLLMAQGREKTAIAHARAMLASSTTPEAAFRLAAVDLKDPETLAGRRAAARERVWQEARGQGLLAPLAIQLLVLTGEPSRAEANELLELAKKHTPAGAELRYSAMGAVLRAEGSGAPEFLAREAANVAAAPPDEQLVFLQFLAANRQPRALLDYLNAHGAQLPGKSAAAVYNLQLEALAQTGQWRVIRQKLATSVAGSLGTVAEQLWRACALAAADPGDAQILAQLQGAYDGTDRGRLTGQAQRVAETAERLGRHDFAAKVFDQLAEAARRPSEQITFLEKACAAYAQTRDTQQLLLRTRRLVELTPGHQAHWYRMAYLEILTKQDVEALIPQLASATSTADKVDAEQAARLRLLWAMVHEQRLRRDNLVAELSGLETAAHWTAGERAVLAGLLASAGETSRAFQLAERTPKTLLLPEEAGRLRLAE